MCVYNVVNSKGEEIFKNKPSQFLTNAPMVAIEIEKRCDKIQSIFFDFSVLSKVMAVLFESRKRTGSSSTQMHVNLERCQS